jgi:hypothetical protein
MTPATIHPHRACAGNAPLAARAQSRELARRQRKKIASPSEIVRMVAEQQAACVRAEARS